MKTKIILLSILIMVSSFTFAQVKSKKTITKKKPKKVSVIQKKSSKKDVTTFSSSVVAQEQNSYATGMWSYTQKFIEDNNSYFDENTGEYSTDNMDEYEINLLMNGKKVTSGNLYIEYLGDDAYQKYKISFGGYSSQYRDSRDKEEEMDNIIRKYLQGKFSATRFDF